ncbi:MAG TPA: hypothetical protein VMG12_26265 [Polyangiaceae bacterium]|nr:hypothetical protein [Polyangiaceae bacterium]
MSALARAGSFVCASLLACASTPDARAPDTALPPESPAGELGAGFRSIPAKGQGLELDLPDADNWRRDARDARSFLAVHAATRSRLLVRAWSSDRIVHADDCERELRQLRPGLPALSTEQRLEERSLRVAGDHASLLVAGVASSPAGELAGYALLFGSNGRHCVALIYSTAAQGAAAPRVIGERLAAMTRVTFERVRSVGIDGRVRVPRR